MGYEIVNSRLKELLEAHGLNCIEKDDWIRPNGNFPLISMVWYPKPEQGIGLLQIDVQIDEQNALKECFAGIGAGEKGLSDGIHNLCANSLHVLLAAFWGINDPEQVTTEEWTIDEKKYTAYIGPFGTRGSDGQHPGIPNEAFDKIESAVKTTKHSSKFNWFRTYFCNLNNDKKVFESLHNNETWEKGESALKSVGWHTSNKFYSVRNFLVTVENT